MATRQKKRTTSIVRADRIKGMGQKANRRRGIECEKNRNEVGKSTNDFLTSVFKPIEIGEFDKRYSMDSYLYLYETAKKYLTDNDLPFKLKPDGDFTKLFTYFERSLELDSISVYPMITQLDNKLEFMLYNIFSSETLHFIPINILHKTEGHFREIIREFFTFFFHDQNLTKNEEQHEMGYLDSEEEYFDEGEDYESCFHDFVMRLKYGDIGDLYNEIEESLPKSAFELINMIENYKPKNNAEKKLLNCISKGLSILKSGKKIFDYSTIHANLDHSCIYCTIDYTLRFIYSEEEMNEFIVRCVNDSASDGSEFFSSNFIPLSPDKSRAFRNDPFVVNFFDWIINLIDILYGYT